jgi:hypothetical protein
MPIDRIGISLKILATPLIVIAARAHRSLVLLLPCFLSERQRDGFAVSRRKRDGSSRALGDLFSELELERLQRSLRPRRDRRTATA